MAIDVPSEMPSPSSPLSSTSQHYSSSSPGRHFYVAVDRLQFKMETLVDLLGVAGRRPWLPVVLCCSSRDELDAVCATVSNLSYISLSYLYSDLAEAERALVLEKFRQATTEWSHHSAHPEEADVSGGQAQSHMMVVTDACIPMVASGEAPVQARVLINFEIPAKKYQTVVEVCVHEVDGPIPAICIRPTRVVSQIALKFSFTLLFKASNILSGHILWDEETYVRRMSTCLAADGIVINMVVGGEVVILKALEESSGLVIAEMPINISEIL